MRAPCLTYVGREGEGGERRLYAYLGTGNFNEDTARFYTDLGLLTADSRLTTEVEQVFQYLYGKKPHGDFKHLLVAPFGLRDRCSELIDKETMAAQEGRASGIILKMNSLEDSRIIKKLYQASRAGVRIQIVVRGICCMMPGVPGLSESVEVRSIVDRYLEHWRTYIFQSGDEEQIYLASADWMHRNLDRRVEVAFPLYDPEVRRQVQRAMQLQLRDNVKARLIDRHQGNAYAPRTGEALRAQKETRDMVEEQVQGRPLQ